MDHHYLPHSYTISHVTDYKIGLRLSVSVSVYPSASTLTVAFLDRLSTKLAHTYEPPKVKTSSLGVNIAPPIPLFQPF